LTKNEFLIIDKFKDYIFCSINYNTNIKHFVFKINYSKTFICFLFAWSWCL